MQCPTCGSSVSDGASICPDCGMELQTSSSENSPIDFSPTNSSNDGATVVVEADDATNNSSNFDFPADSENSPNSTTSIFTTPDETPVSFAARLTLKRNGALTNDIFSIGENVVIGRFDVESGPVDVDMASLPEAVYVSRRHARLWREEGVWKIKDLGARNGTFVQSSNGAFQRVTDEHTLQDGDEIALGNARFEFKINN